MDEPQGGIRTGGWVAAPAVGKIVDRVAPFLCVKRRLPAPSLPVTPTYVASARVAQPTGGL
jgi:cell division protein FtsI (penicillin-binding protein 3)